MKVIRTPISLLVISIVFITMTNPTLITSTESSTETNALKEILPLAYADTPATCPPGSNLNTTSDQCEAPPQCDTGTYNATSNQCESTQLSDPQCDTGTYNATSNHCDNPDGSTTPATCTEGTLDTDLDQCVEQENEAATCTEGTLDPVTDQCEAPPQCEPGSEYDPEADTCITITANLTSRFIGSRNIVARGTAFNSFVGLTNTGSVLIPAGTTNVEVFISPDASLDASDVLVGQSIISSALQPGQSTVVLVNNTVPPGTSPGFYFLIAEVDGLDNISETIEGDNTSLKRIRVL